MTAWQETARALRNYSSAVLTIVEPSGFPASARCQPRPDEAAGVFHLDMPNWLDARPGPASLMSHSHDEQLWSLRGFVTRGALEQGATGWIFRPATFVVTAGDNLRSTVQMLAGTRKAAASYLKRRNMLCPRVPWDRIGEAKAAARRARGDAGG